MSDYPSSVPQAAPKGSAARRAPKRRRLGLRRTLYVALGVLVIGGAAWRFHSDVGLWSASSSPTPTRSGAEAVTMDDLGKASASLNKPIFWVGPQDDTTYELTAAGNGSIFLRYLPQGEKVGVGKSYPTVATYPMKNAYAVSQSVAKRTGYAEVKVPNGIGFYKKARPTSVFIAVRGADYQVELYEPQAGAALRLARAGAVQTVLHNQFKTTSPSTSTGSSASTGTAVSEMSRASLVAVAKQLRQPVYWAGNRPGMQLEYRRTESGAVFLRYLPRAAATGSTQSYLTLGTYELKHAYATTKTLSQRPNAVPVAVAGGKGVAFYLKSSPTSVYVAYRGTNYQVEVYDPNPSVARQVVAQGQVTDVR